MEGEGVVVLRRKGGVNVYTGIVQEGKCCFARNWAGIVKCNRVNTYAGGFPQRAVSLTGERYNLASDRWQLLQSLSLAPYRIHPLSTQ